MQEPAACTANGSAAQWTEIAGQQLQNMGNKSACLIYGNGTPTDFGSRCGDVKRKSHVYQPSLSMKALERERDSEDQRLSWQKHKEALLRTACTQHYLHLLISSFPCVLCAIWCG